jgi:S1-C subfamily serine protease
MVKVATFVKEALVYLVTRVKPLQTKIEAWKPPEVSGGGAAHPGGAGTGRKVSFGSIPDFAYTGDGILLSGVVPGSPAEAAGLQAGDILLRLDDQEIANLKQFSELLKNLKPGQTVKASVKRGEETMEVEVTVVER